MMRRLGSLLALVVLVVAPPLALLRWGFYAWGDLSLTAPADARMLLGVLTIVGWTAWAWFAVATVLELAQMVGGRRMSVTLPGFDLPRALAGGLLTAVFAATAASGPAMAAPVSGGVPLETTTPTVAAAPLAATDQDAPKAAPTQDVSQRWTQHKVVPGDDLWSLAERYCGGGQHWRELAKVNAGVLGDDPIADLRVGTVLRVPAPSGHYTVKAGDTLWQIAEAQLGDGARFGEIVRANASLIKDPAHIEPGWVLVLPGAQAADQQAAPKPQTSAMKPTPTQAAPSSSPRTSPSASMVPAAPAAAPAPAEASEPSGAGIDQRALRAVLGGLASLTVAALLARLALNRRGRENTREVGESFLSLSDEQARLESALGLAAAGPSPVPSWEREQLIATAQRLLAGSWWAQQMPAPRLRRALVGAEGITFEWVEPVDALPAEFTPSGSAATASWQALREASVPEGPVAYPALVTLGERADELVMVDVAGCGVLIVEGPDAAIPQASVSAMVLEMSANAWADQLALVVVTDDARFATSAAGDRVRCLDDIDVALDEIDRLAFERTAQVQLDQVLYEQLRLDPDLGEAWTPTVYLFDTTVSLDQAQAARRAVGTEPVGIGVVVPVESDASSERLGAGGAMPDAAERAADARRLVTDEDAGRPAQPVKHPDAAQRPEHPRAIVRGGADPCVTLVPYDDEPPMVPQTLEPATRDAIAGLLHASQSTRTVTAAWWREYAMPADGIRVSSPARPRRALPDDTLTRDGDAAAPAGHLADPIETQATPEAAEPATRVDAPERPEWSGATAAPTEFATASTDQVEAASPAPDCSPTLDSDPIPDSDPSPDSEPADGCIPDDEPAAPHPASPLDPPLAIGELPHSEAAVTASPGPRLLLLGPVEIEGERGKAPSKGKRRCLEYCAWLLENPGSVPTQMSRAMFVSEATRRSNLSRLRTWLGTDVDGRPYLPEAYTGRIELQGVTSDWQQFEELLGRGVNVVDRTVLHEALSLVRGAPMADAAPGEWAWASRLRQTMVDMIRDAAVVAARLELDRLDVAAARWSIERGLLVAPADELLACELMRVEASTGDVDAVEGIAGRLGRAASREGRELRPETVTLIQELLEGGRRGVLASESETSTAASA